MFDTKERQRTIDFVDYLRAKNNFLLRADDDSEVASLEDLCGRRVGLPKGALEVQLVEEQSAACKKQGDKPVDLKIFPDLNATALGLAENRVDVAPNDSAANAYLMSQREGDFRATGAYLEEGYFAAGVPKDDPLLQELQTAMQALVDSGEMKTILEKWGIADRMPEEITINQAAF
jgi:polar amino acid transport system substrate-binding protein